MHLKPLLIAAPLWATVLLAQAPEQRFRLRTQLKPGQLGKKAFDNNWVYASHTGAGLNDAMLTANKSAATIGFLSAANIPDSDGRQLYNMAFDLHTPEFSWYMTPQESVNFYAAWQPVRINLNGGASNYSAFYTDENGLEWTDNATGEGGEGFAGWLVCKWWHSDHDDASVPGKQLFFRLHGYPHLEMETCADVNLILESLVEP